MLPLKTLRLSAVVPLLLVFVCDRTIVQGSRGDLKRYEFGSPNYRLPPGELLARDPWQKYSSGRPRRQLYPVNDPFSSFFHSMSEGAKVVKHAITDPFRRPKRLLYPHHHGKYIRGPHQALSSFYKPEPDFSTTTEFKGLEGFPNHDTHTEEHYHYDDTGKRIPPPPGFQFPSTLHGMASMTSFSTYPTSQKPDLVPENVLRQIEKHEEQKAEDAMVEEFKSSYKEPKPKHLFTIKTTFKSPFDVAGENGWVPMESGATSTLNGFKGFSGFDDLKAAGGEISQSFPVSSLHTDVMNLPIGKQVQYEKRIIPLKDFVMKEIIDKDTKKPKYTVYQFTKSAGSPTIKPVKELFGDDASKSNSFFISSLDGSSKKKAVTTMSPIVIDTTGFNEIIVTPSPSSKPWRASPSVSAEVFPVSSTWSSPTTRAPARSSTRAPMRSSTRPPRVTTERPNYPEFFFETVHTDSGSSRKRQKETRSRHKPTKSAPPEEIFKGSYSHFPTPTKFKSMESQKVQLEVEAPKMLFEKHEEERPNPSSTQDPSQDGFVKYHVHESPSDSLVELEKPIKMKEHKKYSLKKLQANAPVISIHKYPSPVPPPSAIPEKKRPTTTPHTPVKMDFETVEKARRTPMFSFSNIKEPRKRQRPHMNYRDSSVSGSSTVERAASRGSVKYGDKLR